MSIKRISFIAIALALAVIFVSGCSMMAPPETKSAPDLLKLANAKAVEAQKTQGKVPQAEKFADAIKLYQRADKKDRTSAEAAEALLAVAKVEAGIPIEATPKSEELPTQIYKSKSQSDYAARDTFQSILQRFDSGRSYKQLVDDYGEPSASRIQNVINQAKIYYPWMATTIDTKNQGDYRYKFMSLLVGMTGKVRWFSYWFAMVILAVVVKVIISPLTKAQFKSMKEMQRIQPLIKQLQEKYKGNQQELGKATMALYKEHGVNPLAGCWPILVQLPILFGVYSMIRMFEYQFTNGTFLWVGWGAATHKFSVPLGFGGVSKPVWLTAANLSQPDLILLILYVISMYISQKISIVDPTQAEQQKMMSYMMPIMFFFLIGYLPSAFIFYWFVFNVLQTWQQYHIIHGGPKDALPLVLAPESASEIQSKPAPAKSKKGKK
jgi:YidC/Oxa1 family membrane protein insertase